MLFLVNRRAVARLFKFAGNKSENPCERVGTVKTVMLVRTKNNKRPTESH